MKVNFGGVCAGRPGRKDTLLHALSAVRIPRAGCVLLVSLNPRGQRMKGVNELSLGDLPSALREKAAELRADFGAEQQAKAMEWCADLIEQTLDGHEEEALPFTEAVIESGYSHAHMLKLHRDGKMPMEPDGTVLRRYMPRKPGHGVVASNGSRVASSKTQLARAVAGGADA